MRIALAIATALLVSGVVAAQERPVPSDSSRITIPGCADGRSFVVLEPRGREMRVTGIDVGRRFRLAGDDEVLEDIEEREGTMVEITGLVRKSDLSGPGGISLFGGRVRIGGAQPRDPVRDPMANQTVIDVESFQPLPDRCPTN